MNEPASTQGLHARHPSGLCRLVDNKNFTSIGF
jgi:hypothetical protein